MDNLFQVLIFIFIIWSIVGSAFKKKPEKTPQKVARKNPGEGKQNPSTRYPKSSQDVLEEILGFKIPQQNQDDPYSTNYENENLEKSSQDVESQQLDISSFDRNISIPDIDYDKINAQVSVESEKLQTNIHQQYSLNKTENKKNLLIKSKLKTKSSLRDNFLISEILQKPKALRK